MRISLDINKNQQLEFDKIFHGYKHRVYTYAYSIAKSKYAAEEITQEIFIKLWQHQQLLGEVKNMDAYIYTMARNHSLNYLRKVASDLRLTEEVMRVAVHDANNTESEMQITEYKKLISSAISQLSPQRRLVYQLNKEEGLSNEEISIQLNLSKNTVKNHLIAAISFIKEYLTKSGINAAIITILTCWFF
jgi:RNA polymerase sigma-70 factor (family 1)